MHHGVKYWSYTECVRELRPGVELWQPSTQLARLAGRNPLQGCGLDLWGIVVPRVVKAQPWAEICEHLRCYHRQFADNSMYTS
jgi:hypothetical protein